MPTVKKHEVCIHNVGFTHTCTLCSIKTKQPVPSRHILRYIFIYIYTVFPYMQMHGEDSTSYSRNTALLNTQYLKKDPAPVVIKSLMELTVWRRRDDIEKSSENVTATLTQYPYLGDKEFVS